MISKKSLTNIFILLITEILIGGTASISITTSDWQTYHDEEFGYSSKNEST